MSLLHFWTCFWTVVFFWYHMLILYVFVAKFIHAYSNSNAYIYIFLYYDKGIFAVAFETFNIA